MAATLALPAAAGAGKVVTLRVNDEVGVKKSHILCAVQISKSLVPGRKLVACFWVGSPKSGPAPKTYAVALAVNGEAVVAKVGAGGQIKIVKRFGGKPGPKQGPLGRTGKLFAVGVGSSLAVKNSAIRCAVAKNSFGTKQKATAVGCFKVGDNGKPRPNSYGFAITDGGALIVHFDAKSKGSPVEVVQHGH